MIRVRTVAMRRDAEMIPAVTFKTYNCTQYIIAPVADGKPPLVFAMQTDTHVRYRNMRRVDKTATVAGVLLR
jgi:hypothetical protein